MTRRGFEGVDRVTYKQVKKMDRENMSKFMTDVYDLGYEDGIKNKLDLKELGSKILAINGIGYTRAEKIMQVIEDYFNEKKTNNFVETTKEE